MKVTDRGTENNDLIIKKSRDLEWGKWGSVFNKLSLIENYGHTH